MTRLAAVLALIFAAQAAAETPPEELARQILDAGLDPQECYHVRDLAFGREDARIYLTEGYLVFGKPVNGVRLSAVFDGEIEGGDAEILVMPPSRSERMSLANFTGSPNLDEHFRSAAFLFSDQSYTELIKLLTAHGPPRKQPERGTEMAATWDPIIRNLSRSFHVRLLKDLLEQRPASEGFFYGALVGHRQGNFDFLYDPHAAEQIRLGKVVVRYHSAFFDLWTQFESRSVRNHSRPPLSEDLVASNFRIDAVMDPELKLHATTRVTVVPGPNSRHSLEFDISPQMRILEARVDGQPAAVFEPDSLRASLIRGEINRSFLLIPSQPLEPGHEYEVEIRHEGSVVTDAGNGVYFVGARGSWYPNRFPQFAHYDLTFHYPKELDLVATGKKVEQSEDGTERMARYRIETPVRMAGFNLGRFEHHSLTRGGYTVDVYANRGVEEALAQRQQMIVVPPPRLGPPGDRRWTVDLSPFPAPGPKLKPSEHLEQLAADIAGALAFMAPHFGPPVLKTLIVSPIPGTFGQGFPGLIYLSTLAYLDPKFRPASAQTEVQELFYSDIMQAHETAHQWWGNVVAAATNEDDWLMEALANYSALLYLEKRKGEHTVDEVLADYRTRLLSKNDEGNTIESTGPIVWGGRLTTSQTPAAWRVITYEKGSWIMHMLRQRMGRERFLDMLGELRKRYEFRTVTTGEFRAVAAEALPPGSVDPKLESFFEQWVYSIGIPALKMSYSVDGKVPRVRLKGTVTQGEVSDDFSVWIPIEIQFPKGKPILHWVKTSTGSVPFSVNLRQAPSKVLLDPDQSVLRR